MIGRMVLCLAFASVVGTSSAQEPACTFYKVNTSLLNISKDAGGGVYIDVLEDGDIACVTREQKAEGRDWGFIAHKLAKDSKPTPVHGWSTLHYMTKLSPAEVAALGPAAKAPPAATESSSTTTPAAAAAPPPAAPPRVAGASPPAAAPPAAVAPANVRPEDILHFDQPIPFGPFPVNGQSIKEMIEKHVPMFPPIEGLDESLWKKSCSTCHKWNQARLCEQGGTYVKTARYVLRHQHPFGGTFKIALMRWAKSGCN